MSREPRIKVLKKQPMTLCLLPDRIFYRSKYLRRIIHIQQSKAFPYLHFSNHPIADLSALAPEVWVGLCRHHGTYLFGTWLWAVA